MKKLLAFYFRGNVGYQRWLTTQMYEKNAVCLFMVQVLTEPYKYMIQHFFDLRNPLFAEKVDKMKKYEFFLNFFLNFLFCRIMSNYDKFVEWCRMLSNCAEFVESCRIISNCAEFVESYRIMLKHVEFVNLCRLVRKFVPISEWHLRNEENLLL